MNLITKVAKNELRNLFYSPIAWFLTIAFLVQCAIVYTKLIGQYAALQESGGRALEELEGLTTNIFTSQYALFPPIMQNLYLYIPLLTMGLISREINSGTLSLLYSSPIKIREIVIGKYLAMLCYNLVLVLVIGIFLFAGILDIKSADWSTLLTAAFGFYLLLATYTAIGLFMSSLTSYQIVAAVSTFVMIGVLSYVGGLWQGVDFVRDLTYFLSISGRTENMLRGLISTKDVIYFLLIIYMFLGLSICKLQFGREVKLWTVKAARYLLIVFSALIIGYVTSRPAFIGYWDTSANKTNTLTANTQEIVNELGDSPLEITTYSNYLDAFSYYGLPEQRNLILRLWEPYLRFKPDISFHFVNYYDQPLGLNYNMFKYYPGKSMSQIVAQNAKASGLDTSMFKTPEQIHKIIDLKPELNRFVMQVKYKGRTTYLRVFNDQYVWPSEAEVSAAFKRLLQADMPKIALINGNGERNPYKRGDREYKGVLTNKTLRSSLINQGFDIDTLDLDKQDIPLNLTALVLADPRNPLSALATRKIEGYLANGGNMLIAGEPGRQQNINPLLKQLGVQLADGMLEQKSDDDAPSLVFTQMTKGGITLAKMLDHPKIDTLPVSFKGATYLNYSAVNGFTITPLLETRSSGVHNSSSPNPDLFLVAKLQSNDAGTSSDSSRASNVRPGYNRKATRLLSSTGKVSGSPASGAHSPQAKTDTGYSANHPEKYVTAISLKRNVNNKEQRIIITSDADFMSNSEEDRGEPRVVNWAFNTAIFSWLSESTFPIDASRPDGKDNRVTVSTDRVKLLKVWYIWVLPAILLGIGSVLLIRRKRK
jgi:ABC-2 type transport system permease protein